MVTRGLIGTITCAVLLTASQTVATPYQRGDFLRLDLSKAVLSPEPLGPEAHFEPVPIEARTDRPALASRSAGEADVGAVTPHAASTRRGRAAKVAERPRGAARAKLAQRRSNPLDAQAMDTRIQTWPCKPGSGGICNWR
ncbi:hypothetical protein ACQR1Y_24840 [Bradyrhizobium sp. HKCCYLRH3099]|uniref:hypothetical protein n=1 Tax=unclassified Bradyrhizobium TaxID=2631580 RepID=UPI003EC01378